MRAITKIEKMTTGTTIDKNFPLFMKAITDKVKLYIGIF